MPSLTIISGNPGAGKTTLASGLAKRAPRGLHLPSDLYYAFPANPIDPTTPESAAQNDAILSALGATSESFLRSGYDVFLDGIVGPWYLERVLEEIDSETSVSYILLRTDADTAVERVQHREGKNLRERVVATHNSFDKDGRFASHTVDTTALSANEVFERVLQDVETDKFRIR